MKRYEPLVPVGIFTNSTGTYVKVADVVSAIATLAGSRATFPLESAEDRAFMEGYRQGLDELRVLVEGGV